MKKIASCFTLFTLIMSLLIPTVYANSNENLGKDDIKEGVEVIQGDGYVVTITTKIINEDIDKYVEKLRKQGHKIHAVNSTGEVTASYVQEDHWYGAGEQYNPYANATGIVWTNDLMIGLNFTGGAVSGTIYSGSDDQTVSSKPTFRLTTYGAVGGTIGVIKEYTFTPSSFKTGTHPYTINSGLTGAIAYYEGSLTGDFKKAGYEWQAIAELQEK